MSYKTYLRKIWHSTPPSLHNICLQAICKSTVFPQKIAYIRGSPVYVAGFFAAPTGLGESARLYANELERSGYKVIRIDITASLFQIQKIELLEAPSIMPHQLVAPFHEGARLVIHVNPPMFLYVLFILRHLIPHVHVVAYWAWELEDIPNIWRKCLRYVDSVEVPSSFVARAVQRHTDKEVHVHPHAVPVPKRPRKRRIAEDGVMRVLFIFDLSSSMARKNPEATIAAFQRAFGHSTSAHLTLKVGSLQTFPDKAARLYALLDGWKNITLIDKFMTKKKLHQLYYDHDVYLSLHHSEGYGLTLQEALLHGMHIVATGWSGNMDFMSHERAHCVPYTLVPLEKDFSALVRGLSLSWAEADVSAAADILRSLARQFMGTHKP